MMNRIKNFILEFAPIITVTILVILVHLIVRSWSDKKGVVIDKPYKTDTTYFKLTYDTLDVVVGGLDTTKYLHSGGYASFSLKDSSVRVILIIEKK